MQLLTLILTLIIGYLSKVFHYLKPEFSKVLLRYVFYLGFPALTFYSIINMKLSLGDGWVILANILITVFTLHFSRFLGEKLGFKDGDLGSFMASSTILNYSVIYVFAYKIFGDLGLFYMALFTFGHTISALTYGYYLLKKYHSGHEKSIGELIIEVVTIPLVLSVVFGVVGNLIGFKLEGPLKELIFLIGESSIPVVLIALGLMINVKKISNVALASVLLRVIGGAIIGFIISQLLPLNEIQKWIVIIGSMAPTGFMAAVYAESENLNLQAAVDSISASIPLSLIVLSLLDLVGKLLGWFG